ncbi:MAG TPA: alpha/beta fold hydrolase [Vicinamibacterales bacterium]|nr:alpha/beta fold hydrolase [Vicinamibacterales bacterium]
MRKTLVLLVGLLACSPIGLTSLAFAQALPNISLLSVRYNSMKTAAKAEGELKAQLDEIDKAIADARRSGNMGEVRRQIAKGFTLLDKGTWTPQLDYRGSLALRSERIVIDSAVPYAMRIEQIYRPTIDLSTNLTTKVRIRKRVPPSSAPSAAEGKPAPGPRELGTFDGVSRDLRETPYAIELDLAAVEDGPHVIEAEMFDGATPIGTVSLGVFLHKGLDAKLKALDTAAATASPAVRADVMFPADYIKNVNRGRIELADFNVGAEVARAESVLADARSGKDPFKSRTGDFERHYVLDGANEIMPFRVYVPKNYAPAKATPLVIALHGLGANEDSFFDSYAQLPPQLAEKHGFLMAAPLGFRRDGFYGSTMMGAADAASKRRAEYSEKDVLEVLRLMKAAYNVDESRIYLIGHSMGAIGTWALAAKYPQTWAALVSFSGTGSPALADNMKSIPQFVVHGDADNTVNVSGSRNMVAALKKLNANVTYVEVPGGSHTDVVVPNLPPAFDFLAAQRKSGLTGTRQ